MSDAPPPTLTLSTPPPPPTTRATTPTPPPFVTDIILTLDVDGDGGGFPSEEVSAYHVALAEGVTVFEGGDGMRQDVVTGPVCFVLRVVSFRLSRPIGWARSSSGLGASRISRLASCLLPSIISLPLSSSRPSSLSLLPLFPPPFFFSRPSSPFPSLPCLPLRPSPPSLLALIHPSHPVPSHPSRPSLLPLFLLPFSLAFPSLRFVPLSSLPSLTPHLVPPFLFFFGPSLVSPSHPGPLFSSSSLSALLTPSLPPCLVFVSVPVLFLYVLARLFLPPSVCVSHTVRAWEDFLRASKGSLTAARLRELGTAWGLVGWRGRRRRLLFRIPVGALGELLGERGVRRGGGKRWSWGWEDGKMGRTPPTRRLPLTARHAAAPMTRIAVSILIQPFPPSHSFPSPGARAHRPCTLLGFARGISSPSPSPSPLTFSPSLPCPLWRTRIDPAIDARSLALCPLASLPPSLSLLTRQRVHIHLYRYHCPSAAPADPWPRPGLVVR
ncbi:hypothetical protein B0H14DRAFT_3502835 [Mycena olivaceomarginata]|nr:hypothetical protein B0H14DRAFT_3502835 [Mycena olivaceomarginata]